MSVALYFAVLALSILVAMNGRRLYRGNRTKALISTLAGLWTALYAGLTPILATLLEVQDEYLEGYYQIGSILLLGSYLTLALLLRRFSLPELRLQRDQFHSILILLLIAVIVTIVLPESWVATYLRFTVVLPGAALLYLFADTRRRMTLGIGYHAMAIFGMVLAGRVIDSKEVVVVSVIGPILISYVYKHRGVRFGKGSILLLAAALLFIFSQPIVSVGRQKETIDIAMIFAQTIDNTEGVIRSSLERLLVLDALARTLSNEFSIHPDRPTAPLWAYGGWVFSVFPGFFERPNHAREALIMTGYSTSHDEVNVALTYLGHLIWAFGIKLAIPFLFLFWMTMLVMTKIGLQLRVELAALFLMGLGFQFFRLEGLAVNFLSGVTIGLVLTSILQLFYPVLANSVPWRTGVSTLRSYTKIRK